MPGIEPSGPSGRTAASRLPASRNRLSSAPADEPHHGQDHPAVHRPRVALHRLEVPGGDRDLGRVDQDGAVPGGRQLSGRARVVGVDVGQQDARGNRLGTEHGPHGRPDALGVLRPAGIDQHPRGAGTNEVGVGLRATPRPQAEHARGNLGGDGGGHGSRWTCPAPPGEHGADRDDQPQPRQDRAPPHLASVPEGSAAWQRRTAHHDADQDRRRRTAARNFENRDRR